MIRLFSSSSSLKTPYASIRTAKPNVLKLTNSSQNTLGSNILSSKSSNFDRNWKEFATVKKKKETLDLWSSVEESQNKEKEALLNQKKIDAKKLKEDLKQVEEEKKKLDKERIKLEDERRKFEEEKKLSQKQNVVLEETKREADQDFINDHKEAEESTGGYTREIVHQEGTNAPSHPTSEEIEASKKKSRDIRFSRLLQNVQTEEGLKDILDNMEYYRYPLDVQHYNLIQQYYAQRKDRAGLEEWMKIQAKEVEINQHTYSIAINFYAEIEDVTEAQRWIDRFQMETAEKSSLEDVVVYTTICKWYSKRNQEDKLRYWYNRMFQRGVKPNSFTFVEIFNGFKRDSDMSTRINYWLKRLDESGLEMDSQLSNVLINLYTQKGNAKGIEEIVTHMLSEGITMTIVTYNTIMKFFAENGSKRQCDIWLEYMKNAGTKPDIATFNTLLDASVQQSDPVTGWYWVDILKQYSYLQMNRITYDTIFRLLKLQRNVEFEMAQEWYQKLIDSNVKTDSMLLNRVIDLYCSIGHFTDAEKIAEEMMLKKNYDPNRPDMYTFTILIAQCQRDENFEGAYYWYQKMKGYSKITGPTYIRLISLALKRKETEMKAIELADEALDRGLAIDDYTMKKLRMVQPSFK